MPVAWPDALPTPLRSGLKITPNPDVKARAAQSGRKEIRRWGTGKGDTLNCTLRLWNDHPVHGDQVTMFKRFWDRQLNFGLNWINADWLETGLGYSGYYLRIIGYSQRRAEGEFYQDFLLLFTLQAMAAVWTDTLWPVGDSGSGHDFSYAAIWVVEDLPQTDCATRWSDTTYRWLARNIPAAQLKMSASGTSSTGFKYPIVCKTAVPPYLEIKRRSGTSHNNYSTTIVYDTASASPVTDIGDKAIHMYVSIPLYGNASCYANCMLTGLKGLGIQAYNDRFDFRLFDKTALASIPRTSLQTHGSAANLYIVSVLYRHTDQVVKAFVEGIEVVSGVTPYPMTAITGPNFSGWGHSLHGVIVENEFDESSVQAAIDFFDSL